MKFFSYKIRLAFFTLFLLEIVLNIEGAETTPHIEEHSLWDDEDPDKHYRLNYL